MRPPEERPTAEAGHSTVMHLMRLVAAFPTNGANVLVVRHSLHFHGNEQTRLKFQQLRKCRLCTETQFSYHIQRHDACSVGRFFFPDWERQFEAIFVIS